MGLLSPPWAKGLRVLVPMSCCDKAAEYLIGVLGGESATKQLVGGTKWWQIRGVKGCGVISVHSSKGLICGCSSVDGEWIVGKKDWQEAEKNAESKECRGRCSKQPATTDSAPVEDTSEPDYTPDMDEQKCILFFHGGKLQREITLLVPFVS